MLLYPVEHSYLLAVQVTVGTGLCAPQLAIVHDTKCHSSPFQPHSPCVGRGVVHICADVDTVVFAGLGLSW